MTTDTISPGSGVTLSRPWGSEAFTVEEVLTLRIAGADRPALLLRRDVREVTWLDGRAVYACEPNPRGALDRIVQDDAGRWCLVQYVPGKPGADGLPRVQLIPGRVALGIREED